MRQWLRDHGVLVIGLCGPIGSGKTTVCETLARDYDASVPIFFRNFADSLKEQIAEHFSLPLADFYSREGKARVIEATGATIGHTLQSWGTALRNGVSSDVWIIALQSWLKRKVLSLEKEQGGGGGAIWSKDPAPLLVRRSTAKSESCGDAAVVSDSSDSDDDCTGCFPKPYIAEKGYYRPRAIVVIGDVRMPNEFNWIRDTCGGLVVELYGDPAGVRKREEQSGVRDTAHVSETALKDKNGEFTADIYINTDKTTAKEACAQVVESLNLFAHHVRHRDNFYVFYWSFLSPFLDAVVRKRQANEGMPLKNIEDSWLWNDLWNRNFEPLLSHLLVDKQIQWIDLQKYVLWLAQRAEPQFIDRYIADWYSIFDRSTPYTRFLRYADQS